MNQPINILWAVNPLDLDKAVVEEIELLLKVAEPKIKVHPVYVASPGDLEIDRKIFLSSFRTFSKGAQKKLNSLLSAAVKPDCIYDFKVLSYVGTNVEGAVDVLVAYSKKIKADFIVLGLSKKSQKNKKKFGSFSRLLLARSESTSIAIGLSTKKLRKAFSQKLLFATDLSHESMLDMIKFSYLSKKLGTEVTFIKKGNFDNKEKSEKRLAQFSKLAKKCGVKTSCTALATVNPSADELASYASKNNYLLLGLSCSVLNTV